VVETARALSRVVLARVAGLDLGSFVVQTGSTRVRRRLCLVPARNVRILVGLGVVLGHVLMRERARFPLTGALLSRAGVIA
jgi:hypothetical protein